MNDRTRNIKVSLFYVQINIIILMWAIDVVKAFRIDGKICESLKMHFIYIHIYVYNMKLKNFICLVYVIIFLDCVKFQLHINSARVIDMRLCKACLFFSMVLWILG